MVMVDLEKDSYNVIWFSTFFMIFTLRLKISFFERGNSRRLKESFLRDFFNKCKNLVFTSFFIQWQLFEKFIRLWSRYFFDPFRWWFFDPKVENLKFLGFFDGNFPDAEVADTTQHNPSRKNLTLPKSGTGPSGYISLLIALLSIFDTCLGAQLNLLT